MPEQVHNKYVFTLHEVSLSIRKVLGERYTSSFWVKAELNKLNYYKHSGHCYPELVEKAEGKIVAQIRSTLWRDDYVRINQRFLSILQQPLQDGIKIMFEARIVYDAVHGLSLSILDIDPTFTLGDLEREKQESIAHLKEHDLYYKNKHIPLPLLPQRVAIISVETSKGYADFMSVLAQNPWGYHYFTMLFPALLQGDKAALDIRKQLNRIKKVIHHFDVVAIIRGGGGDVGLSCYNDYELAAAICSFPIPVITGIGHSTNETVCELISHTNAITPTKLAELLLQHFHEFSVPVHKAKEIILRESKHILEETKEHYQRSLRAFQQGTLKLQLLHRKELTHQVKALNDQSQFKFQQEKQKLSQTKTSVAQSSFHLAQQQRSLLRVQEQDLLRTSKQWLQLQQTTLLHTEKNLDLLRPEHVLKRGYSITRIQGRSVRNKKTVKPGEEIHTILFEGELKSIVTSTHEKKDT